MARPRCPNCREPVSPFAAGCALCGADLEAPPPPRRLAVARPRRLGLPAGLDGTHALILLALILLAVGAPLFGGAFSLLLAAERNREGDPWVRNAALAVAALAVVMFFVPVGFLTVGR